MKLISRHVSVKEIQVLSDMFIINNFASIAVQRKGKGSHTSP